MWEYTRERYIIPDEGKKWVNTTLNDSWRVYKSRVKKKYYSRFESDKKRLENKPEDIPLEDFKQLLNYWADEEVQSIAEDNAARRNSFTETHTLGPQSLAQVRDKLKKKDPNQGEPSDAQVYLETRERKTGRDYKTTKIVDKRIKRIKRMMNQGRDPNLVVQRGKSKGRGWLLGRNGSRLGTSSSTADPTTQDPYVLELTNQIRQNLETELEDKVNRKVQENMAMLLKKLGEANPGMNLDVGNFCATISSEADGNGTPITDGATS
ncbi:hypothetical protein DCAR_0205715 [Daucus carota subsp. sativus]|uniref:Transposase, Ptta/En/Spm, plant n=2 Tax=Daucus carota subsp. sativus TaxID=79200 RepID=A0AAF1AKF6_DAUCS|nr:hypothetical protein DCAR_0205715 [Daucus carota subsp. sativus]